MFSILQHCVAELILHVTPEGHVRPAISEKTEEQHTALCQLTLLSNVCVNILEDMFVTECCTELFGT